MPIGRDVLITNMEYVLALLSAAAMKLILTVDTEADTQWDAEAELTTYNLGHVPRFQSLL